MSHNLHYSWPPHQSSRFIIKFSKRMSAAEEKVNPFGQTFGKHHTPIIILNMCWSHFLASAHKLPVGFIYDSPMCSHEKLKSGSCEGQKPPDECRFIHKLICIQSSNWMTTSLSCCLQHCTVVNCLWIPRSQFFLHCTHFILYFASR